MTDEASELNLVRRGLVAAFFSWECLFSNKKQSAKSVKQCNIFLKIITKSCVVASPQVLPFFQNSAPVGVDNTISISTLGKKIRTLNCHLATETK